MDEVMKAAKMLSNVARGLVAQRDIPKEIGGYQIRKTSGARSALLFKDHPHISGLEMESATGVATVLMHRIEIPLALIGNYLTTIASLTDGDKHIDKEVDSVIAGVKSEAIVDRIELFAKDADNNAGVIVHENGSSTLSVRRAGANLIIAPRSGKGNVRLAPVSEASLRHFLEMHQRAVKTRTYVEFKN